MSDERSSLDRTDESTLTGSLDSIDVAKADSHATVVHNSGIEQGRQHEDTTVDGSRATYRRVLFCQSSWSSFLTRTRRALVGNDPWRTTFYVDGVADVLSRWRLRRSGTNTLLSRTGVRPVVRSDEMVNRAVQSAALVSGKATIRSKRLSVVGEKVDKVQAGSKSQTYLHRIPSSSTFARPGRRGDYALY